MAHLSVAGAFLRRDFKIATSYHAAFVLQLGSIFLAVPVLYFMGSLVDGNSAVALKRYGGNYFGFLLIGIALLDYLAVSLSSFSQSLRDGQLTGTLEIVLLSPTPLIEVLIYSSIWSFLFTTLRFVMYLLVGALFNLELGDVNLLSAFTVLFVGVLSFIPFGIVTASLVMLIKRGEALNSLFAGASMFFGGALFPVASMPEWLQWISKLLPFTYALEGLRQAIQQGAEVTKLIPELGMLALFAAILMPLSCAMFSMAVRHTRTTGSLGHY